MKAILSLLLLLAGCSGPEQPARPSAFLDVETLKALPYVHAVEVSPATKPKRQIIHILNWHYLDPETFHADGGEDWAAFLDDVEAVQVEQMALLRELAKSHGLKAVFLEGIAQDEMPAFRKLLGHLARWKKPELKGPSWEVLSDQMLIDMHRQDTLEVGAGGRLMMTGELEVIPAEDAHALEAANPVKDGKVQYDEAANERREDAIVRNVLASESPVSVLVMGGGHDLTDNVERIGGQVEYVRVQVNAHRKATGE